MANSIKEYPAVADATYVYTTPEYLEGRGDTDIKVYVNNVEQLPTAYNLNGTALTFVEAPQEGKTVTIRRTTPSTREVDFADGSLLDAQTLDLDSVQVYYIAEEAKDRADEAMGEATSTQIASNTFYKSSVEEPTNPSAGDLWYDLSQAPYQVKIWDGTRWVTNAPLITKFKYQVSQEELDTANATGGVFIALFNHFVENQTNVYLNGIRLSEGGYAPTTSSDEYQEMGTTYDNIEAAKLANGEIDWFFSHAYEGYIFRADLNPSDIIEVQIASDNQYYSEIKITEENVVQLHSEVMEAQAAAVPKYEEVLEISNNFLNNNYDNIADRAEEAETAAVQAASDAEGYADTAQILSGQAQDLIAGWVQLDHQAIQSQGANDPVLYSQTGIDINTTESVKLNGIPLPFAKGLLTLGNDPALTYQRPVGVYSLYGVKVAAGEYQIWVNHRKDGNGTSLLTSNNFLTAEPVPHYTDNFYSSGSDYNVSCFYQGDAFCNYKINKDRNYFTITLQDEQGVSIDSGELLFTIEENL